MSKKAKWILTAIVVPIVIGVVVDRMKLVDFSSIFMTIAGKFKALITWELGISLPLWTWVVALAVGVLIYFFIRNIRKKIIENDPYETYKSDTFLGIRWSWDYCYQEVLKNTLLPLCPKCNFELEGYRASAFAAVDRVGFGCPNCGWKNEFDISYGH